MSRQPESKLVKQMQAYLHDHGARCFKIQGSDDSFQEVGIPDLLCSYRGRFVGLEVKLPGEKPSAVQKLVLCEIADAGGIAACVTTVGQVAQLRAEIDEEVDGDREISRPVNPFRFVPAPSGSRKRKKTAL